MFIIDGKKLSYDVLEKNKQVLEYLKFKYSIVPKLVVLLIGDNAASELYVKNKVIAANKIGMKADVIRFAVGVSLENVVRKIKELNVSEDVHGIIVQLPLPRDLFKDEIMQVICPEKDVDGFHPNNKGKLAMGIESGFIPCTPLACLDLIFSVHETLKGKKVVIVGRSAIVGAPLSTLLLNHDATVTVCHSCTKKLSKYTKQSDIVVLATGTPNKFSQEYFSKSATIIDVGINYVSGKIVGDANFKEIKNTVAYITPVPGGVGPMTVARLLSNTIKSACKKVLDNAYYSLYKLKVD